MTTNKSPDWGWWRHVPTVTLREAVALSLNIDPARSLELLSFHERREFEKRQALAKRCLGEGLDGPLNWAVVHYEGAEPVVSLKAFATWAIDVDWQIPAALAQLASSTGRRVRDPEPPAALADQRQLLSEENRPNATDAFDVQLGWIGLAHACEIIGSRAWEAVQKAIRREALRARCRADGVTRDLKPHWLDFLAFDQPREDVLWFDREKAWRARTRDLSLDPVPERALDIVLSLAECRELWPVCTWPQGSAFSPGADHSPFYVSARPPTANTGLSPESGDFFMPTGAPGRPSRGMHVIRAEFDRRRVDDQCKPSLREEAGELESWFHLRYPRVQPVTLKTIENNIRVDYRTWKASRQN